VLPWRLAQAWALRRAPDVTVLCTPITYVNSILVRAVRKLVSFPIRHRSTTPSGMPVPGPLNLFQRDLRFGLNLISSGTPDFFRRLRLWSMPPANTGGMLWACSPSQWSPKGLQHPQLSCLLLDRNTVGHLH